ncbi:MAG: FlgD immunoglobulin-like domain containing protein [bacterium]
MQRVKACALVTLLLLGGLDARTANAQCLLANPSFELSGSGGSVFAGWNQFGSVGSSTVAPHGAKAARVSGPNAGGWDVSAYWQRLDTAPGQRWAASVSVRHSSVRPLTGLSRAIVNVEWRNSSGALISYESYTAADLSTPTDTFVEFAVETPPAPAGTASTHFLLGVLQSPGSPVPDVYYDQATFEYLGPPTLDQRQWLDFPGGRVINFSGRSWRVKGPGFYGPGPNLFCDTPSCTWVDAQSRLHLTIQNISGSWYSTEVALEETLGYGDYVFTTFGRLDTLHPTTVFGLFLWEYGPCYDTGSLWWNPYNEIDVEFSRWGVPGADVGQFVAQPYDYPGNISRFGVTFSEGELTSHAFRWLPDRVEYRSWRGGPNAESPSSLIHTFTYTGPHIPRPDRPRVHLNLWQSSGPPTSLQEVVLDGFTFVPACDGLPCVGTPVDEPVPSAVTTFSFVRPNPFLGATKIQYTMANEGGVKIAVYDVAGRLVRTLVSRNMPSGSHEAVWNGRDDAGNVLSPGVYMYQFRAGSAVETGRIVLLK